MTIKKIIGTLLCLTSLAALWSCEKTVVNDSLIKSAVKALNGSQWAPNIPTVNDPESYISGAKPTIDDNWIVTYTKGVAWDGMTFNLRTYNGTMVYNEPKDRRWPFPYTELHTNKALDPVKDQNPGY